jgi:hypothetical protein
MVLLQFAKGAPTSIPPGTLRYISRLEGSRGEQAGSSSDGADESRKTVDREIGRSASSGHQLQTKTLSAEATKP